MIEKVWISKWALTEGIFMAEVDVNHSFPTMAHYTPEGSNWPVTLHSRPNRKSDWHRTKEEAVKQAEENRKKKIISLEKQLKHLNNMSF